MNSFRHWAKLLAPLLIDFLLILIAWYLAYELRLDPVTSFPEDNYHGQRALLAPWIATIMVAIFAAFKIYKPTPLKFVSTREINRIGIAILTGGIILTIFNFIIESQETFLNLPITDISSASSHVLRIPRGAIAIFALLSFLFTAGFRYSGRLLFESSITTKQKDQSPAIICGTSEACDIFIRQIKRSQSSSIGFDPVALLLLEENASATQLGGIPCFHSLEELKDRVEKQEVKTLILLRDGSSPAKLRDVVSRVQQLQVKLLTIPSLNDMASEKVELRSMRRVRVEDLLGRSAVNLDFEESRKALQGKRVMVTGAGGTIGRELVSQIISFDPASLIVVGRGENSLHELVTAHPKNKGLLTPIVVDVQDKVAMHQIFEEHQPEIIFHAAAHKHVTLMEKQPIEALTNNVIGTAVLASLAHEFGAERFVLISSDKAVRPTSVMGASKRLSEEVIFALAQESTTLFSAVRFGNVLGSRGSVIRVFEKQLEQGLPLTLTDSEATRFFMTDREAVSLVLRAGSAADQSGLYHLEMGDPISVGDLLENFLTLAELEGDQRPEVRTIGLQPGEKKFEELLTDQEIASATELDKIWRAKPSPVINMDELPRFLDLIKTIAVHGDKPLALRLMMQLVEDYQPSQVITPATELALEEFLESIKESQKEIPEIEEEFPVEEESIADEPEIENDLFGEVARKDEHSDLFSEEEINIEPTDQDSEVEPVDQNEEVSGDEIEEDLNDYEEEILDLLTEDGDDSSEELLNELEEDLNDSEEDVSDLIAEDGEEPSDEILDDLEDENSDPEHEEVIFEEQSTDEDVADDLAIESDSAQQDEEIASESELEDSNDSVEEDGFAEAPVIEDSEEPSENEVEEESDSLFPETPDLFASLEEDESLETGSDETDSESFGLVESEQSNEGEEPLEEESDSASPEEVIIEDAEEDRNDSADEASFLSKDEESQINEDVKQETLAEIAEEALTPEASEQQESTDPNTVAPNFVTEDQSLNKEDTMSQSDASTSCVFLALMDEISPEARKGIFQHLATRMNDDARVIVSGVPDLSVLPESIRDRATLLPSKGGNVPAIFNAAVEAAPEHSLLVTVGPNISLDMDFCNKVTEYAKEHPDSFVFYPNYLEVKNGKEEKVELHEHNGCPHERFDFGEMIIYRAQAVREAGMFDDSLVHAWEYDMHLKLMEIGLIKNIPQVLYKFTIAEADDTQAGALHSPGRGKLGGFSYVFYPEDVEREVTTVFEKGLKRINAWIDHETAEVPQPKETPEVLASVVIPILNRVTFIENAIRKVQNGTFQDFEVCIVDNGSTDGTVELIEKLAKEDSRIRLFHGTGGSIASALNHGIREAKGKYICQLDSDDEYAPTTLEKMIGHLESHPKCGLCISYYRLMNEHGVIIDDVDPITHSGYTRNQILRRDGAGAVRIFPKAVLEEFGYYDEENYGNFGEDYDMVVKTGEKYDVDRAHEVLYHYRRHSDNTDVIRDPAMKYNNKNRARQQALRRRIAINEKLGKKPVENP